MAARFDDAKAGWQIWRQSGFTLARDELNARLEALGHMPVSARTFAHYEKLRRYGYERYVPINQLDVKSLKDPLWDEAVRGRYPVYSDTVGAVITFRGPAGEGLLRGTTVELSPAYASIRVNEPEHVQRLARPSFVRKLRSGRVVVSFPLAEDEFPAVVEKVAVQRDVAEVVLRFASPAPVETLTGRTLVPPGTRRVLIEPSAPAPLLSEPVRKLYWLFQAVDTGKVVCDEFLYESGFGEKYALSPVRLHTMRMEGNIELTLEAGRPALLLVTALGETLRELQEERGTGRLPGGRRGYLRRRDEVFSDAASAVKGEMLTWIAEQEKQARLPLGEPLGRSGELAESQLLPAIEELMDIASGKVTLTLVD